MTFDSVVTRFSDKEGHIKFDDFVAAIAKLKRMFGKYSKLNIRDSNLKKCLIFKP